MKIRNSAKRVLPPVALEHFKYANRPMFAMIYLDYPPCICRIEWNLLWDKAGYHAVIEVDVDVDSNIRLLTLWKYGR